MVPYQVIMEVQLSSSQVLSAEMKIVQILFSISLRNTYTLFFMLDIQLFYYLDFSLPTLQPDLPLRHKSCKDWPNLCSVDYFMTMEN
jgi:hypothetical protein